MARLYSDEDFDLPIVIHLRNHGHDVLTVAEAGKANQGIDDPDVLAYAIADGRAVITHNRRHFLRLHRLTRPHGGIIVCTRDSDHPEELAQRIHDAIAAVSDLTNQLIRIYHPNTP